MPIFERFLNLCAPSQACRRPEDFFKAEKAEHLFWQISFDQYEDGGITDMESESWENDSDSENYSVLESVVTGVQSYELTVATCPAAIGGQGSGFKKLESPKMNTAGSK